MGVGERRGGEGRGGVSDVSPLQVLPVSFFIVRRLHPSGKLIRSRVLGPSAGRAHPTSLK